MVFAPFFYNYLTKIFTFIKIKNVHLSIIEKFKNIFLLLNLSFIQFLTLFNVEKGKNRFNLKNKFN